MYNVNVGNNKELIAAGQACREVVVMKNILEFDEKVFGEAMHDDGYAEGYDDGFGNAQKKTVFSLVSKGALKLSLAAEELDIPVSELEKMMTEAGYKIPESV